MSDTTFYNSTLKFAHVERSLNTVGDTSVVGEVVSEYITQIYGRLTNGIYTTNFLEVNGPFNGLVIETWHSTRAEQTDDGVDWDIEHVGGLTTWHNMKVNHTHASRKLYSHEFFHNFFASMDFRWDGNKNFSPSNYKATTELIREYRRIRWQDFTNRTNETERIAEDAKQFFGCDGATGHDWADDADCLNLAGKVVRWADEVPGLKNFLQYSWPVWNWLKDKNFNSFTFYDTVGQGHFCWFSVTNNRWESFQQGRLWKWGWTNNKWEWSVF